MKETEQNIKETDGEERLRRRKKVETKKVKVVQEKKEGVDDSSAIILTDPVMEKDMANDYEIEEAHQNEEEDKVTDQ